MTPFSLRRDDVVKSISIAQSSVKVLKESAKALLDLVENMAHPGVNGSTLSNGAEESLASAHKNPSSPSIEKVIL